MWSRKKNLGVANETGVYNLWKGGVPKRLRKREGDPLINKKWSRSPGSNIVFGGGEKRSIVLSGLKDKAQLDGETGC